MAAHVDEALAVLERSPAAFPVVLSHMQVSLERQQARLLRHLRR